MKNKKYKLIVALCLVAALFCLAACGGGSSESDDSVRLIMATGGTGGTYYPFGGALAQTISTATDYIRINVNASGASAENVQLIGSGQAHLAIVQNDVMDYAFNATNTWTSDAVTNMRTLMSLYPEVCQIVVTADSGITSVADLEGKRVSTGDVGSGVEANAAQILAAYGLSFSDLRQEHLGFSPSADAMRDNAIDAFFVTAGVPNTAIMDLQNSRDIRILNLSDAAVDALIADYAFYSRTVLTSDDYSFIDDPVNTVSVRATLIATPDLDEQVAYDIVKAILENIDEITLAHARGAYLSPENAILGISVQLHPGARRYFQEIGVL